MPTEKYTLHRWGLTRSYKFTFFHSREGKEELIEGKELSRIAGEAKLFIEEKDGIAQRLFFITTAPVRGFEKIVVGKNPLFAIEAVMRICGICHTAHAIASSEAIEHAIGILPPRNGLILRETLGLLNRLQSHLLQFVMVCGDLLKEEVRYDVIIKLLDMHSKVSECLLKLGGAATHPPLLTVGGIAGVPKESALNFVAETLKHLKDRWRELRDILLEDKLLTEVARELQEKRAEPEFLASHLFYGDRFNISLDGVSIEHYWDYRKEPEDIVKEATTLVAFYMGKPVEVGPRARMSIYRFFSNPSLFGLHEARVKEVQLVMERIRELLEQIKLSEPFRTQDIIFGPGKGVGVYEAPRGTLIHFVELGEEGRIQNLKIILPTLFNIPVMEEVARGLSVRAAEAAVRLYDPCIPCATHLLRIGGRES